MLSRKAEDYLEAILNITEQKGYTRVKDITQALNVKPSSVVEMLKRLNESGHVTYRKYDGVTLTPVGKDVATVVKDRHDTIKAFLMIIKVPEAIANKDACIIEHELESKTIVQLKSFVNFVKSAPDYPQWLEHFEIYCKTGKHPCEEKKRKNIGSSTKTELF
ncbi:MAG: metal-dependent transcriptional regulator [Methanosarcinales archaeon]